MPRNGAIDELRGIAVLAVVCSHVGLVYGVDSPLAFGLALPALGVGVDLFLVLSGYVIWQNVMAMRAKAGGDAVAGALAFWLRRFSRVALPAWATLAAIGILRLRSGVRWVRGAISPPARAFTRISIGRAAGLERLPVPTR